MRPIRTILVAVKNTRQKSSPAIAKATVLARALNARLELFHAISDPLAVDALMFADMSVDKFEADERGRHLRRLDAIAEPLVRSGLEVGISVEWDFPAHEALIRRAHRTKADLIVVERHVRRHIAPWFLRYTDWELLRRSPVPVLLVKSARKYNSPTILAAVDPSHAFAKTTRLDQEILTIASEFSVATNGQLHALHAYTPTIVGMKPAQLILPDASATISRRAEEFARTRLDGMLGKLRNVKVGPGRRHLIARHPVDAIPELARQLGCDIVVMGALSRSGLKRFLIGNTAERLLDDLPCDLLIVKPPAFASRVPARSRGVQFVPLMSSEGHM
ncbi:MAG: universal stress protein [Pseudomonadota bacterium]